MKLFANDAPLKPAENIRRSGKHRSVLALALFSAALVLSQPVAAAAEEGVAVAIVYDTSGSMKEPARDANGKQTARYLIANRALKDIAKQLETFATNSPAGEKRRVDAGLYVFQGSGAREAIKFGAFDAAAIRQFADTFSNPDGSTPLGNAMETACRALLRSPLSRKHVLIITDGQNTAGPDPSVVFPSLKQQATAKGTVLSAHFVAFNVDAKVFDGVKKQGATVVGAADEKQLNGQLEFIMQKKILLEEEEPAKKQ